MKDSGKVRHVSAPICEQHANDLYGTSWLYEGRMYCSKEHAGGTAIPFAFAPGWAKCGDVLAVASEIPSVEMGVA